VKPAAAFTIGLWTGALVAAGAGALRFACGPATPAVAPAQPPHQSELARLEKENAQLATELQRLRQTLAEWKTRTAAPAADRAPQPRSPRAAAEPAAEAVHWMDAAVANSDVQALPRLEEAALQNDVRALRALAALAAGDNAATLARVWASGRLNAANLMVATRLLGATIEVNPHGAEWVQALTGAGPTGAPLVLAAAEGLAQPDLATATFGRVDFAARVRFLDTLLAGTDDAAVTAQLVRLRDALLARWAAAGGAAGPTP